MKTTRYLIACDHGESGNRTFVQGIVCSCEEGFARFSCSLAWEAVHALEFKTFAQAKAAMALLTLVNRRVVTFTEELSDPASEPIDEAKGTTGRQGQPGTIGPSMNAEAIAPTSIAARYWIHSELLHIIKALKRHKDAGMQGVGFNRLISSTGYFYEAGTTPRVGDAQTLGQAIDTVIISADKWLSDAIEAAKPE